MPRPTSEVTVEDPVRAVEALETLAFAIDAIRQRIEDGCELAVAAFERESAHRAALAAQYDEIRKRIISDLASLRTQHTNAPVAPTAYDLAAGADGGAVDALSLDFGHKDLGLPASGQFASADRIEKAISGLDRALAWLDRASEAVCRDARFLSARIELSARR